MNYSAGSLGPRGEKSASDTAANVEKKKLTASEIRRLLPGLYALIRPRRNILLLGLLVVIINRLAGLVLPASSKILIDDVLTKGRRELLLPIVGAVIGATIIQALSGYGLTQLISKAAQRLIAELRLKLQQHVIRLHLSYFDRQKTGVLVSRIMNDVEGLRNLIGTGLLDLIGGSVTALLSLAVLSYINVKMTAVTLIFMLLLGRALIRSFAKVRPMFRERSRIQAQVTGRLTESLGGVRVVKSYRAEEFEIAVFASGISRLLSNVLQSLSVVALMALQSSLALGLVGATTMYLGAHEVLNGSLTLGGFVTFTLFLGYLVAPIAQVASVGTQITEAFAGLERMNEVLEEVKEGSESGRSFDVSRIEGDIEFRDVWFEYEPGQAVLKAVSFHAPPGTITAFVGRSGAGKTTIISILASFYRPTKGTVLVDGRDLSTITLDSYRSQLGIVLQETFLFDGSVRENVAFSRPGASEEEIIEACRISHVEEFVVKLPKGYDTIVGERGVKLSGGQRQRIAIARALLADPRILILDEATSNLDTESERLIQGGLARLMQGRTVFVIAHRLSTIRQADQILVMEAGKILERGNHHSLAASGHYAEMLRMQSGSGD
jgi:subfamily B ATP-binding cassette protein MsbA